MGISKCKRIIERSIEELHAAFLIAKKTSVWDSFTVLRAKKDIQVLVRNGYQETERIEKRLLKKHEVMSRYFDKTITSSAEIEVNDTKVVLPNIYSDVIWVCWWQGLDQAPDLVRTCIRSVQKHAGSHRVIVITDKNYKRYTSIPAWVEEKRNRGIISKTHFSDILRLSLLSEHGGMWLDATFLCVSDQIQEYFKFPVWSIKRPGYAHASVAAGQFANFALACDYDHRWVFQIIRKYLLEYWEKNDLLIDYLVLDYLIVLIQKRNKEVARTFCSIPCNNPACDELLKILGRPYSERKMDNLKQDTSLFKLTWKHDFEKKVNGEATFYGLLLEGAEWE